MELNNPEILKFFSEPDLSKILYLPTCGIVGCELNLYTEHFHLQSKLFFKIIESFGIEYSLFAGSSIGLCRSGRMMPWTDDHDVIIMNDLKPKFRDEVIPELRRYGFEIWGWGTDRPRGTKDGVTYISGKYINKKSMRIDIFWSYIDKNSRLKNDSGKGLYHKCNLPADIVFPFEKHSFHDGTPFSFFSNYRKEVELSYGDIHKSCVISTHTEHIRDIEVQYSDWNEAIEDFETLIGHSTNNSKKQIEGFEGYRPMDNVLALPDSTPSSFELLSLIAQSNASTVICNFTSYFREMPNIAHFFPEIRIIIRFNEKSLSHPIYLNYVSEILLECPSRLNELKNYLYINEPLVTMKEIDSKLLKALWHHRF